MNHIFQRKTILITNRCIDILRGREKSFAQHVGKKPFPEAGHANLRRYFEARKRFDKSVIVSSVVNSLLETGDTLHQARQALRRSNIMR
jgi:predicted amidophosphoribosyltransferase